MNDDELKIDFEKTKQLYRDLKIDLDKNILKYDNMYKEFRIDDINKIPKIIGCYHEPFLFNIPNVKWNWSLYNDNKYKIDVNDTIPNIIKNIKTNYPDTIYIAFGTYVIFTNVDITVPLSSNKIEFTFHGCRVPKHGGIVGCKGDSGIFGCSGSTYVIYKATL
jgi:hypothetical protein